MKKATSLLPYLVATFIAFSCGDNKPVEKPQETPNNKKALAAVKTESKVTEAIITDANILYVSVADDGTKRNGYASYLCQVLQEHHATIKTIRVMKTGSINDPAADNAYGILLGESECK